MKKLICTLLIIALVFTLSATVFAASDESGEGTDYLSEYVPPENTKHIPVVEVHVNPNPEAHNEDAPMCSEPVDAQTVVSASQISRTPSAAAESIPQSNPEISPYASIRFEFYDATPGIVLIADDDIIISSGEVANLNIQTCVWAPEHYNIRIGFWNARTSVCYYHTFTDGQCSGTYSFRNLPAGTYRVFMQNDGETTLTTGYMRYTIS